MSRKTATLNFLRRFFQNRPSENALYHLVKGRKVTDSLSKLVPNHYQYPQSSYRQVCRQGIQYKLDLSDLMDWHVFFGFQEDSLDQLMDLCQPGDIVFDVGTNTGRVLLKMAERVGPKGMAFGFEPHPVTHQKAHTNLQLNPESRATLFPFGLSDKEGFALMQVPDARNQGRNQIVSAAVSKSKTGLEVPLVTIDKLVEAQQITRLDVLKIDVEGYEYKVLIGAHQSLSQFQPKLFIEIDDQHLRSQGSSPNEVLDYLCTLGYRDFYKAEGGSLSLRACLDHCHFDLIALPPSF